jgi:hypothetical protein
MRTNALGDVFSLLFDAVSGSPAATIKPKFVNTAILRVSKRHNALDRRKMLRRKDTFLKVMLLVYSAKWTKCD